MKVLLLPSSFALGPARLPQYLTTFVINDSVAIDAGSLGLMGTPEEQARIRHVILSHAHLDHVATLPMFLLNIYGIAARPVTIHASKETWRALRRHLFNNDVWLDLARPGKLKPFFRRHVVAAGKSFAVAGLRFTPVPVNHTVPTLGYIVEDTETAIVIVGDTGPTEEIWRRASRKSRLAAVFLEVSYPDAMAELAKSAAHLTPATFAEQVGRLTRKVPIHAVHLKAGYIERIERELGELNLPDVTVCQAGTSYTF